MIEIVNEAGYDLDEARLQAAAALVLSRHEGESDGDITIAISDDQNVADLNRQYRGVDAPTDVLSFPMDSALPNDTHYLGDLMIAYPYASAQAEREGHALNDSLTLLVVHGTLHLLGYDHDTPEHRAEMWAAQESALVALGIPIEIVPALENGVHDEPET
ncbi:MAG: rRNA maturation RNase YbeY [Chloroflexota bacterium]